MPSSEILAVLADEVGEVEAAISGHLECLVSATEAAEFDDAREQYREQVQRFAEVCASLELEGLQQVCAFVERNLGLLHSGDVTGARKALFEYWCSLVLGYLKAPGDGVYGRELAELLQRGDWPAPLEPAAAVALEQALLALDGAALDEANAEPSRPTRAEPQDVDISIPEDVNRKLVDAFLTEGPAQAGEYASLLQQIVRGEGWIDELNECRRLIHGLKGSANTVGVRGIATLCHHVEDIFEYLAKHSLQPSGELASLLIRVADTLEMMFEALLGTGAAPGDAQAVLQRVLDCANQIDRGEIDIADSVPAMIGETHSSVAAASESRSAGRPGSKPADRGESKIRIAAQAIDDMLRASGEMTISSGHVRERVRQTLKVLAELRERHSALWDRSNDMEGFLGTQGIAASRRQALTASGATTAGFDPLEMDQYSELHTYVHAMSEVIADLQILGSRLTDSMTAVDTAVNQQASLNEELHDLLIASRMLPAGTLESRLSRIVRQGAEQCGKQARLTIEGRDVMLDDQMVSALIDPLQHLLRNAVDHGIEPVAYRQALGKPDTGEIVLTFARDGNYLVVTCRDDGAGLDLARISAHAVASGLVDANATLSDEEIAQLILRVGFSTADSVTTVSGRGVGMDVVNTHVGRLKGTIGIQTQAGAGSGFTLRLPMSLGIAHCLLALAEQQVFALPSDNLERIVYDGAQFIAHAQDGYRYDDGEVNCPAYSLASLVGLSSGTLGRDRHVVLMNDGGRQIAIAVESVVSGQDLVIKKLGSYLQSVAGTIGASILGDGSVAPILDLSDLLRINRGELAPQHRGEQARAESFADVLVVDDSLSVRTALATLLAEQGFSVRTAKDGIEAIEAIGERCPAAVLADLEMPRMNGLELTAHIRAGETTRDLPIIMVTSRTASKHRRQAQAAGVDDYITKPYQESELVTRLRTVLSRAA